MPFYPFLINPDDITLICGTLRAEIFTVRQIRSNRSSPDRTKLSTEDVGFCLMNTDRFQMKPLTDCACVTRLFLQRARWEAGIWQAGGQGETRPSITAGTITDVTANIMLSFPLQPQNDHLIPLSQRGAFQSTQTGGKFHDNAATS